MRVPVGQLGLSAVFVAVQSPLCSADLSCVWSGAVSWPTRNDLRALAMLPQTLPQKLIIVSSIVGLMTAAAVSTFV